MSKYYDWKHKYDEIPNGAIYRKDDFDILKYEWNEWNEKKLINKSIPGGVTYFFQEDIDADPRYFAEVDKEIAEKGYYREDGYVIELLK